MVIIDDNFVKNPLVSVRMLTYNHERFISTAIESVVRQECDFNFELIISDDYSTDRTREILLDYQRKYPRIIKLNFQDANKGLMRNYKDSIQLCRGKYISGLSGDDYWTVETKLQQQVDYLESHPDVGLVYTDVTFISDEGELMLPNVFENASIRRIYSFEDHLKYAGFLAPMTWMYRNTISPLTFNYTKDYTDESYPYLLDVFQNSKIAYINVVTSVYRKSKQSASRPSTILKQFTYLKGVFDTQKEYIEKYQVKDENLINYIYNNRYVSLLPLAIEIDNNAFIEEARQYFLEKDISADSYDNFINRFIEKKNRLNQVEQSNAYKIGKIIVRPFAWLKRLLKRKDR